MPHRKRKTRKLRGSRTMGWGQIGQHRGSGSRGGYGKAGLHKHKWFYTLKYAPNHFGRHGFKSIYPKKRAINISQLVELAYKLGSKIDLSSLGIDKLVGKGKITFPVEVYVKQASESAIKKIEGAGGKVIILE
jgi:large subunit ribosomal protein L15